MYPSREDCARLLPCVNTPVVNSTGLLQYTGSGNDKGICPWQCKPGWYLKDATCYDCNAKGFNTTLHAYTEGCAFACLPGLFYRGPSNADTTCTKPCVRLDTVLFPRCSDYFVLARNNGTRFQLRSPATYLLGYCGSNATDPTSELGVVRHKGVFGFQQASGGGKCGDAMLSSQFEECDDGNTQDGDGCSAQCTVELTDYWDCDVLGELCLPNCGWPDLQGYVLPAPSLLQGSISSPITTPVPWCTGITYARDFLRVPLPARGLWLQTHLISCQCERNPHQTLPYSECNYTNQGCRQCLPGYYQDDLYARCTPCGSACALGFWPFNLTRGDGSNVNVKYQYHLDVLDLCGPTVATSQDLSFADPILDPIAFGVDQLKLGCAPCSAGSYNLPSQVLFTTPDCQWKCRRDYSNLTEPKYYCQSPLSPLLGVCNQRCLDCAQSLKTLQTPSTYGWYVQSCADGVGHAYARCANLSDPNALFIGNSELVGDSTGCPWACKSGYQALRGRCVPCGQTACAEGEVLQLCAYSTTSYYCAPCSLIKPAGALQPLQVWYSVLPGYKDCVPGCEPGFAYQLGPNETCKACASYLQCDLDQLLVPCTQTSDAHCLPCPAPLPSNSEFYSPGTCKTRCVQGFASSSSSLSPQPQCLSCSLSCPSGKRTSSKCYTPDQRLQLPTCVPCDPIDLPLNRPTEGRMWAPDGEECATTCRGGWMFEDQKDNANLTCVECNLTQCAYGQQGTCSYGKLQCTSCPSFALLDVSQQFKGKGDCTLVCAPGYYDDGVGGCLPVSPATGGTDAEDKNGLNSNSSSSSGTDIWGVSLVTESGDPSTQNNVSSFPTRVLPHS
jgi:cysteine-rich repeat protein